MVWRMRPESRKSRVMFRKIKASENDARSRNRKAQQTRTGKIKKKEV